MKDEDIEFIFVHCSATKASQDIRAKDIDRWHRQQGWLRIGYHWVIPRDGSLEVGREMDQPGAHVKGYNHRSLGICMVGGLDEAGNPENNFTVEQFECLAGLLQWLQGRFPTATILGHRDVDPKKECPCFDVRQWVKENIPVT